MTSRRLLALAAAALLAVAACGESEDQDAGDRTSTEPSAVTTSPPTTAAATVPPTTAAPDPATVLPGRTFVSTAVEGFALVDGTQITVVFDGANISANAGCNQLGGTWTMEGTTLVVPPMFQTEMACDPPALMDQDTWLTSVLTSRPTLTVDGDTLTIAAPGATVTLVDREVADPDRPLEGTPWTVETLVAGDVASSLPAGVRPPTLTFDGASVAVDTGCNTGSGPYTVEAGAVTFGPIALTRMACVDPGGAETEQHVLTVLTGTATVAIDADVITLSNGANGLVARASAG